MTTAKLPPNTDDLWIGGEWVVPVTNERMPVINPTTEEWLSEVPDGLPADVDRAVVSARKAFEPWAATPVKERAAVLGRIADGLKSRQDEIAALIATEVGSPLRFATNVQAGTPIAVMSAYADLLADFSFGGTIGNALVEREPIGVVGAITPWNYPLHQVVAKIGAALAAGCTVVLKPSEVAPLSAFVLAEILHDAGLPPGVVNLVSGTGPVVGEAIAAHPGIDMVSFTGSGRAGKRVSVVAADTLKRVALELGGKSANVLLPDADLAKAVKVGLANCYVNGGQTCTAWTRLLVPADKHDEVVSLAVAGTASYTVGDPFGDGVRVGPLVSRTQRDRVRGFIEKGVAEGATLAAGGPGAPDGLDRGWFVRPTVFADVKPTMTIAQEEIFGPVLSILPYSSEEEALEIANGTPYGLAGAVFSADRDRALAFARRMRTGQVHVNGGPFNPAAPFGGYKQSGNGRELGRYGIEEFTELKALLT